MDSAVVVVAAVLLASAVVERRLQSTPLSGAMVFTAVGLLASELVTGLITVSHHGHGATVVLEVTLVLVLFTDAMAANLAAGRPRRRRPAGCSAWGCP